MAVRFIAGAVCPKCGAMDTLKAGSEDDGRIMVRECVDCGYQDRISQGINSPREMATRVTPQQKPAEVPASAIKIIDPNANTEDS